MVNEFIGVDGEDDECLVQDEYEEARQEQEHDPTMPMLELLREEGSAQQRADALPTHHEKGRSNRPEGDARDRERDSVEAHGQELVGHERHEVHRGPAHSPGHRGSFEAVGPLPECHVDPEAEQRWEDVRGQGELLSQGLSS